VRPFKLLALDIDGTLLRSDKALSPRNRSALCLAQEAGVSVVLVTGRRYPAARRVAEEIGGRVPLILHNGALIIEDGEVLRCCPLAREVAHRAIRTGREHGADPVVHCGRNGEGRLLVDTVAARNTLLASYLGRSHPDVVTVPDLLAAVREDPLQVMFGGDGHEMETLLEQLTVGLGPSARIERTLYPSKGVGILDVLDPAAGKAEALALLLARLGLHASQTLAIGDNWNDHEMLEQAGLGLVMGNADPRMLELGLPVLPSNDEDGVAVAIERHVLRGRRGVQA
jgi:Cof subfamily protein (haloacid dehalogenase superfamily)